MLLDGGRAARGLASTSVASKAAPREMASSAARRATHTSRVGAVRGAKAVGDAGLREVCPLVAGRGGAGGGADARASAVRLGRAKRADDGRAGSAAAACSVTAGVAGVVARCAQNPEEGGRGVSGASAAASAAALAAAVAAAVAMAAVAVAAAAVAAAAVAWAAMCDCHADAVLGGVVQARGAAVVVASAAVPRGAKRSPTPNSAWVPKSRGIGNFGWASRPNYSQLPCVLSGSVARLVALSRGAAQVLGETAPTGQGRQPQQARAASCGGTKTVLPTCRGALARERFCTTSADTSSASSCLAKVGARMGQELGPSCGREWERRWERRRLARS